MFSFGGIQRSYSFPCFHADVIPNSTTSVGILGQPGELVMFKNSPNSTGNVILGSTRLGAVGTGITLAPGKTTGWISANNLNCFWHIEEDATTYLEYAIVYDCTQPSVYIPDTFPLPEIVGYAASVTGGTEGELLRVWNTNPDGEGSLKNAITLAAGYSSAFIWITATGTVELDDTLISEVSNVTFYVDPRFSLGFQLTDYGLVLRECSNVIVYNMRSRPNNQFGDNKDPFSVGTVEPFDVISNVALINCSAGLNPDEGIYVRATDVTIQNCIIGSGLGGILLNDSDRVTIYGNFMPEKRRLPRVVTGGTVQVINNYMYSFTNRATRPAPDGLPIFLDVVGNYYKHNFQTVADQRGMYVDSGDFGDPQALYDSCGFYLDNNIVEPVHTAPYFMESSNAETTVEWVGVTPGSGVIYDSNTDLSGFTIRDASEVFEYLEQYAGSFPRDALDRAMFEGVEDGTWELYSNMNDYGGLPVMGA